jgi:chemotaxis protein methyltransferase CheR
VNDPSHAFIRELLRDRAAIVLDDNKGYLIDSRLLPVCKAAGLGGIGELVARLRRAPGDPLVQDVVEALTTNETSFYRDGTYYEALEQSVLPELAERRARERALTIWSAAASTGQEPYSLAMMLADLPAFEGWRVRIQIGRAHV